jgi:transketolase
VHHTAGVETTTGPLGQGIANSVGFAIAEEALRARFGAKVMDHCTYCHRGRRLPDGGGEPGGHRAGGRQQLSRLIVLFDDNGITIDGKVSIADATDQGARFAASGWHVQAIDGHDPRPSTRRSRRPRRTRGPSMIACRTHIALGSSRRTPPRGTGALTDAKLIADTKAVYGWEHGRLRDPADVKARWEQMGERGAQARAEWEARLAALPAARQASSAGGARGAAPAKLAAAIRGVKKAAIGGKAVATRKSSEIVLEAVNAVMPETLGGSADLTGSNNTLTKDLGVFGPENRKGRYIHYGIREHGMAAAMNGMALHGGVVPYGGTFMCFADYCRPAVRLSALMGAKVVYVFTHDSIGLGEDGPTHQPVEHLAMLRATPGLLVLRPADTVETAEAWEIALTAKGPSVLALSRQNLKPARTEHSNRTSAPRAPMCWPRPRASGRRS